jgi:hypothetical protein
MCLPAGHAAPHLKNMLTASLGVVFGCGASAPGGAHGLSSRPLRTADGAVVFTFMFPHEKHRTPHHRVTWLGFGRGAGEGDRAPRPQAHAHPFRGGIRNRLQVKTGVGI